jgi:hypothetical protein
VSIKSIVAPLVMGILIASPSASFADYDYQVNGTEGIWEWEIDTSATDGIDDLRIYDLAETEINGDGFDEFGIYSIDGDEFDTSSSDGDIIEGQIVFSGEEGDNTEDGTVTWTFSNNNWQQVLASLTSGSLRITGDLGSDGDTTWLTQGSYLLSYEDSSLFNEEDETRTTLNNGADDDPIFLWETDGEITTNGEDSRLYGQDEIEITAEGTSLTLTIYAYAHVNDLSVDTVTYFNAFERFVNENKYRTDIFRVSNFLPAKKVVPLRMTSNLTFGDSQYGSDMLSDLDGELRKLINMINLKYGSL